MSIVNGGHFLAAAKISSTKIDNLAAKAAFVFVLIVSKMQNSQNGLDREIPDFILIMCFVESLKVE